MWGKKEGKDEAATRSRERGCLPRIDDVGATRNESRRALQTALCHGRHWARWPQDEAGMETAARQYHDEIDAQW